jgi:L-ascorbate metabolism protein UlaG (beta-lactamase superfamily)
MERNTGRARGRATLGFAMKTRYWIASALAAGSAFVWALRRPPRRARRYRLEIPPGAEPVGSEQGTVQFIGTATTLIRYGGMTLLTDPNFLHRGEQAHIGYGMHAARLTDPAIEFDDLPEFDFVLLSHMHEDHFDKFVQERLARNTPILTTASAARTLRRMGFTRLYGLRTWDAVEVSKGPMRLRVRALPGTHGPLLVSAFLPDVMGSMLEFRNMDDGGEFRMYISGDTLVFDRLQEVRRQYPNIHLGLLHLGGTRVMGILVTMDAEQGIEALRIVQPDLAIPIHYNDYDVFRSSLDEFRRAVERAGLQDKVKYLQHGEIYSFTPKGMRQTVGQQPLT